MNAHLSRNPDQPFLPPNTLRGRGCKPQRSRMAASCTAASAGAFVDRSVRLAGAASGALVGLTFAAKDLYDVAGHRTGFGSPAWLDSHPPACHTAPAVQALLDAGASLRGKTVLEETAYGMTGCNHHYGTPTNPACPDRQPGGSSSGSAVAAASGEVDFALGTDTAGSVRVPASYCGVLGIRVTHGSISLQHACPLAASFDTVGWFARNAATFRLVGDVLFSSPTSCSSSRRDGSSDIDFKRWLVAEDAFDLAEAATTQAIFELRGQLAVAAHMDEVTQLLGPPQKVVLAPETAGGPLRAWPKVFQHAQAAEAWRCHGDWIREAKPQFGPGIKERWDFAAGVSTSQAEWAARERDRVTQHMEALLGMDAVLALPTTPGPAPLLESPSKEEDAYRAKLLSLTCAASLSGLPQVHLPIAEVDGCPVGLGLIGPRHSDRALLRLTEQLMRVLHPGT